jgi:hypothetical protein
MNPSKIKGMKIRRRKKKSIRKKRKATSPVYFTPIPLLDNRRGEEKQVIGIKSRKTKRPRAQ